MGRTCSLSLICALVWGLGVPATPTGASPGWSVAAWVCADGDLSAAGTRYAAALERTAAAQGWSLALEVDRARPGSVRTTQGASGKPVRRHQEPVSMGSSAALAQFLGWAATQDRGQRWALVIYGHGPGADTPTMLAGDALVRDDSRRDWLTGAEVAQAVAGAGLRPDLVVLDCCYGMRAETLWALRSSAEIVVGSSGRALSAGLPWEALRIEEAPAPTAEHLAGAILARVEQVAGRDGGWSAIRPRGLQAVTDAVAGLAGALDDEGGRAGTALASARAVCADRGPGRELCDLRELCARLGAAEEGPVGVAARRVVAAIDLCVCDGPGSAPQGQAELLVWMPGGVLARSASEESGEFAAASGWSRVVEGHSRRQQELLRRTMDTPQRGRDAA